MTNPITIDKETDGKTGRYVARIAGVEGEAELVFTVLGPSLIAADHTGAPASMRGTGAAAALVEHMIADARANGFRIAPVCPYVLAQYRKHAGMAGRDDEAALLNEGRLKRAPAGALPAVDGTFREPPELSRTTKTAGETFVTDKDSLIALHTALIDASHGYDEAIEDSERSDLRVMFQGAKALHDKAHAAIHEVLLARGLKPDDGGSFMSSVHKTVISVRPAVAGLGLKSLSAFASAEERIAQAYDRAIEGNADDRALVGLLERQKAELEQAISQMKAIATAAA